MDWENRCNSPLSESWRFPLAANAKNQTLDSSGVNLLIHRALFAALCGLRDIFGERIWREKWHGERKFRSISVQSRMVEVRRNPQEPSWGRGRTKKMTNCRRSWSLILVEVAGIEPASRTPPDCRNYNHEHSMGPDRLYFKACGKKHVAASLVGSAIISFYSKAPTRIARLTWRSIFRCSPSAVMPCASSCLTMASIPVRSIW